MPQNLEPTTDNEIRLRKPLPATLNAFMCRIKARNQTSTDDVFLFVDRVLEVGHTPKDLSNAPFGLAVRTVL